MIVVAHIYQNGLVIINHVNRKLEEKTEILKDNVQLINV